MDHAVSCKCEDLGLTPGGAFKLHKTSQVLVFLYLNNSLCILPLMPLQALTEWI